jgi:chromosome segregation ATPase
VVPALQHADQVFASQRQVLEQEQEAMRSRLQTAVDRVAQLESEAAQAAIQIDTLNQGVQTRDGSIADLRSQALEFLRQREGLESRVRQLEESAETGAEVCRRVRTPQPPAAK